MQVLHGAATTLAGGHVVQGAGAGAAHVLQGAAAGVWWKSFLLSHVVHGAVAGAGAVQVLHGAGVVQALHGAAAGV